eukprot:CFRG4812T1
MALFTHTDGGEATASSTHETTLDSVPCQSPMETDHATTTTTAAVDLIGSLPCSRVDLESSRPPSPISGEETSSFNREEWSSLAPATGASVVDFREDGGADSLVEASLQSSQQQQVLQLSSISRPSSLPTSSSTRIPNINTNTNLKYNQANTISTHLNVCSNSNARQLKPTMIETNFCINSALQQEKRTQGMLDPSRDEKSASTLEPYIMQAKHAIHKRHNVKYYKRKYMYVSLNTQHGHSYRLRVRESDTVKRIKFKVTANTGIPIQQQHLIMNGTELVNDGRSAVEHGIRKGCIITLVLRASSGNIRLEYFRPEAPISKRLESDVCPVVTHLKLADGTVIPVPPDTTSADLQEYVRQLVADGHSVAAEVIVGNKALLICLRPPTEDLDGSLIGMVVPPMSRSDLDGEASESPISDRVPSEEDTALQVKTKSKVEIIREKMAIRRMAKQRNGKMPRSSKK